MTFGFHPFFLVAIVGGLAALALMAFASQVSAAAKRAVVMFVAMICLAPVGLLFVALQPDWFDARFRTYHAFYNDIQAGMTRAEVDASLARHYPADGSRRRPKVLNDAPEGLSFFMNPEDSVEPNCEGIFLTLHDGRVTKKIYSPD